MGQLNPKHTLSRDAGLQANGRCSGFSSRPTFSPGPLPPPHHRRRLWMARCRAYWNRPPTGDKGHPTWQTRERGFSSPAGEWGSWCSQSFRTDPDIPSDTRPLEGALREGPLAASPAGEAAARPPRSAWAGRQRLTRPRWCASRDPVQCHEKQPSREQPAASRSRCRCVRAPRSRVPRWGPGAPPRAADAEQALWATGARPSPAILAEALRQRRAFDPPQQAGPRLC